MQDKEKAFIQATILFSKASNLNIYVRFSQRDISYLTEQKSVWHKYLKNLIFWMVGVTKNYFLIKSIDKF